MSAIYVIRRKHRKVCLFAFYCLFVACLQFLISRHHIVTQYTHTNGATTEKSRAKNDNMAGVVGGDGLSDNISLIQNVTSTGDMSGLHMVQMRLVNCIHRGYAMSKCLEDEYVRERQANIHNEMKRIRIEQRNESIRAPGASKVYHDVIKPSRAPQKPAVTMPAKPKVVPTDNPKKLEEFYNISNYRDVVNEFIYDFVLTPKQDCDEDTFMIILVHSFHPYVDRRHAIRASWGGAASGTLKWPGSQLKHKLKLVFMLGTHPKQDMNELIKKEGNEFGDIVQGNFFDAYVNMTLKSLLGLKYVHTYCRNVKYMLKSDDDMFINLPHLLSILDHKPLNRSIMGPLNVGSKVYRSGKWKVLTRDFPFYYYPPYEAGAAYVITNDIVYELFNTSRYVRSFHVDDAYITGVIGKMIGVNHTHQFGFAYWVNKAPTVCEIKTNKKITGTKMTPKKLDEMWTGLKSKTQCV